MRVFRSGVLSGFVSDKSGSVTAFTAVIFIMLVVSAGMAVDFMRHEYHRAELQDAVDRGVLARQLYCERPPRYEYRLTEMGMALSPALVALMRWGDRWLSDGDAPTVLVHEACGAPIDQQFVCWECDETFTPYDIASRPGPGALHHTTNTGEQ